MIKIYRKTTTIKAEQFDGSDKIVEKYNITSPMPLDPDYTINTLEGDMVLGVGDWIATGVNGEHWPITDDVFKKTYAELPVVPHSVDVYIQLTQMHDLPIGHAFMFAETLDKESFNWIVNNSDTFARAWLDGYTVED